MAFGKPCRRECIERLEVDSDSRELRENHDDELIKANLRSKNENSIKVGYKIKRGVRRET